MYMAKSDIVETVRDNITMYRKKRGLTQVELAKRMRVSQRIVAYYESEATSIPISKVQQFADALEVSLVALVEEHKGKTKEFEEIDIRLIKKLKSIEALPRRARDALWHNINMALQVHSVSGQGKNG